ncbi:MAG: D-alanyl-D-alanine carboxypeptidase family protein [Chromatiales bacterium]
MGSLLLTQTAQVSAIANEASIVIDADNGAVLSQEGATQRWYPASLTKVMTIYLTFTAIDAGTLKLDDTLTASAHVAAQPDSRLGLSKGDRITVKEAILAVITQSANDAAVLLAEQLAEDELSFANAMTEQARKLGMTRTVFRNATGLPHDQQTTTARDMALLARALVRDFPLHYQFFGARSFAFKGMQYGNINTLLGSYPGADGLKTGFTCGSGYNLVASVKRDGHRLIGVVLGAENVTRRTSRMIALFNAAFAKIGKDQEPVLVAALEPVPGTIDEPPPFRLKPEQCALGIGIREGRLPGWGLLFGTFQDQARAKKHIERMRAKLKPVLRGGQPALVRRQMEDVTTWKAMVVGLKQVDAINACLHLIKTRNVCLVQSPRLLNPSGSPAVLALKKKKGTAADTFAPLVY